MAHEIDMSTGRPAIAFVKQTPWHGLGTKLEEDADFSTWQTAAGLDWEAKKAPVTFKPTEDGPEVEVPQRYVLHRSDNNYPLSVVSDRYQPVQPSEVVDFFQTVCEGLGNFRMETLGALAGGRKIWGLAAADEAFTLGAADEVQRYLLLATSFDQSLPTIIQQTSVRVVCANTLSFAFGDGQRGKENQLRMTHLKKFNMDEAALQMSLNDQWAEFGTQMHRLAEIKLRDDEAMEYFRQAFANFGDIASLDAPRRDAALQRRADEMFQIYRGGPGQQLPAADRTVWGAVNAVTYFTDHACRSKSQAFRLDKAWFGDNAALKSRALELALTLV